MKLKALMMSAATAALLAGAATAQDDSGSQAETAAEEAGDAAEAAGEAAEQAGQDAAQETQDAAQEAEQAAESAADSAENAAEDAEAEASEETDQAASGESEGEPTSLEEMTVGDVTGMGVFGPEDERIGEIDYVIERGNGPEAVIGIGGFLGLGEYTVALPMDNFQMQQDPEGFGIDTDRETLEQQPELDESQVEALPDDTMMSDLMSGGAGAAGGGMDSGSSSGGDMSSGSTGGSGGMDSSSGMSGGDTGSGMDSSGSGGSDMEDSENSGN